MSVYDTAVLADSPSIFWELQDTSGTTAADASGNGHAGTLQGTVTLAQVGIGDGETAALLDGSTGYISSPNSYVNPSTYSLEVWFKTANAYASGGNLFMFGSTATGASQSHDRYFWMDNSGLLHFGSVANNWANSSLAYNDGHWHHAVATFDTANGSILYVDGSQVGTNATTSTNNYTGFWRVGDGVANGPAGFTPAPASLFIAGTLAKAAIYTTVLSPTRVAAHFSAAQGTTFSDSPTGTLTLTGSNVEHKTYTDSPAGSLALTGSNVEHKTYTDSPAGSLALTGSITEARIAADSPTGNLTLAGSTVSRTIYSDAPVGQLVLAGSLVGAVFTVPTTGLSGRFEALEVQSSHRIAMRVSSERRQARSE